MKIQSANLDFENEVEALKELQKTKVVPKIYAAWTCRGTGYLIIEKLQKCDLNKKQIYEETTKVLDKIYKAGWLHVDIHKDNIMCRNGNSLVVIDFGWAIKKGPKGDKQLYPYHPLSRVDRYNKPLPWFALKAIQDNNLEINFNPRITHEEIVKFREVATKFDLARKKARLN
jgi:serine/threonine protein kinase